MKDIAIEIGIEKNQEKESTQETRQSVKSIADAKALLSTALESLKAFPKGSNSQ